MPWRTFNAAMTARWPFAMPAAWACVQDVHGDGQRPPCWACRTSIVRLRVQTLRIAPLRHLPVIKDVMVDYGPFVDKYRAVMPFSFQLRILQKSLPLLLSRVNAGHRSQPGVYYLWRVLRFMYDAVSRSELFGASGAEPGLYLVRDSRDGARREPGAGGEHGCWRCYPVQLHGSLSEASQSRKGLKRDIVLDWFLRRSR